MRSRLYRVILASVVAALLVLPLQPALAAQSPAGNTTAHVIVRAKNGSSDTAAWAVRAAGGQVTKDLSIIGGVSADVPASAISALTWNAAVLSVYPDTQVQSAWSSGGSSYGGDSSRSGGSYSSTPQYTGGTPQNYYLDTTRARSVWNLNDPSGRHVDGENIGVAVIDSGVDNNDEFNHIDTRQSFATSSTSNDDTFGHGTHVGGIVAGNGHQNSAIQGMAPDARIISLKVCDDQGNAKESDVVNALQWVLNNKDYYKIRVVNLSINCGLEQPYDQSGLDAAVEILWFNKVVVVVSAGNKGSGTYNTANAAPANDPFVITVGASDEKATTAATDDVMASFSAYGTTAAGFKKPDVVAPGKNIWSVLSSHSKWNTTYPDRVSSDGHYFRLSGTSMAAPMVAGAAALMLQKNPSLNPDQVKYRLTHGRTVLGSDAKTLYPYLDAYSAATTSTTVASNQNIKVSALLTTGSNPVNSSVMWNSVMWNSVMWNSVMWNSVMWNSVMWNSVMWNSVYFSGIYTDPGTPAVKAIPPATR